jgi:hypothetical protein
MTHMTIARQRLGKHIPKVSLSTIQGHQLLGNEPINTRSGNVTRVFRGVCAEELQDTEQSTTKYNGVSRRTRRRTERVLGSQGRRVRLKIDCEFLYLIMIKRDCTRRCQ